MTFAPFLRRVRLAFVIVAVAMAVFGVTCYFTIGHLVRTAQEARAADEHLMLLEQLNTRLGRTDIALRHYAVSGTPSDLDRFQARIAELRETVALLVAPPGVSHQDELEHLIALRTQYQFRVAEARAQGGEAAAFMLLDTAAAQRAESELRALLRTILKEDSWRAAGGASAAAQAQYLIVAAIGVLLAMLASAFWIFMRYERERQRVTRLLEESEAMSRALVTNIADGLVTLSEDLTILSMNGSALQMLGYAQEDVVGLQVADLMLPEERESNGRLMRALLDKPEAFRVAGLETTALRKDGRQMPVQVSVNDVRFAGRRLVTALLRDMTGIRQATEAAQASEQDLRQVTDTLPVIIAEVGMDQRFRFVNRACAEFLGRPAADALGRLVSDLLPAELYEAHSPHIEKVLRGTAVRYEVTAMTPEGTTGFFDMHLIPKMATGSRELVGFYAFGTDMTLLKRIDRMKTEFISTVSHELRTPLTSVRGSLGLMSGGVVGKLPDAAAHLVGIAQSNCDRLIRLVNDILDADKIESGNLPLRLQPVQIAPLVKQALATNESFAREHGVELRMHAPDVPLTVGGDVDRLLQVLTNLLSNAVKFSPHGAAVEVRLTGTRDRVRVEVADEGPGIPLEFQQRIFQKFSQADASDSRAKGGTGLGLNISRTLVEKMDGRIGFSSTPGQGATFFFELPRRDLAAAAPTPAARAATIES